MIDLLLYHVTTEGDAVAVLCICVVVAVIVISVCITLCTLAALWAKPHE